MGLIAVKGLEMRNPELLKWVLSEMAVKLFSFADVCECTCVHCTEYTRDAHKRLCTHWVGRTQVW